MPLPVFEVVAMLFMAAYGILERGTWIGWLMTVLVIWQTLNLIRFYKEHP